MTQLRQLFCNVGLQDIFQIGFDEGASAVDDPVFNGSGHESKKAVGSFYSHLFCLVHCVGKRRFAVDDVALRQPYIPLKVSANSLY